MEATKSRAQMKSPPALQPAGFLTCATSLRMVERHVARKTELKMVDGREQLDAVGGEGIPWPLKAGTLTNDNRPVPWPWAVSSENIALLLSDLVGRQLRVSSGSVSQEVVPGRVTILTNEAGHIVDIYVDPGRPSI